MTPAEVGHLTLEEHAVMTAFMDQHERSRRG